MASEPTRVAVREGEVRYDCYRALLAVQLLLTTELRILNPRCSWAETGINCFGFLL